VRHLRQFSGLIALSAAKSLSVTGCLSGAIIDKACGRVPEMATESGGESRWAGEADAISCLSRTQSMFFDQDAGHGQPLIADIAEDGGVEHGFETGLKGIAVQAHKLGQFQCARWVGQGGVQQGPRMPDGIMVSASQTPQQRLVPP
jgi:hypothetical protein